jgi:hypothetical protein
MRHPEVVITKVVSTLRVMLFQSSQHAPRDEDHHAERDDYFRDAKTITRSVLTTLKTSHARILEARTMRRCLPLLLVVLTLAVAATSSRTDEKKPEQPAQPSAAPLAAGKNLPGAFHPFNVTGPRKSRYHCLVSETGLNSGVMILSRDLEATEPFKELLQRLDNAIDKNPNVKMSACCVYIPDELPEYTPEMFTDIQERKKQADLVDDKREELAEKIEDVAKGAMLKNVILALTHKNDLKAYALPDNAVYTIIIYHKYEVRAVLSLGKEMLTPDKVSEIIKLVGDKLGARRK